MREVFQKNGAPLSVSEMFERMNTGLLGDPEKGRKDREEKAKRDLLQKIELLEEDLQREKGRANGYNRLLDEANEKVRLFKLGKIEALQKEMEWFTQERYRKELRKKDEEIKNLKRKLAKEPHKNLRKMNGAVWNKIIGYIQNHQGKISHYRNVSKELGIPLSTLHGIVKKLHEVNQDLLCPDCGVLPKPSKKQTFTGQYARILVCSNCEKEVAKS
ncbi:MAG: hypothetical protein ACE5OZ_23220 [Candidatus Heimdallarchaeota archaeon]